MKDRKILLSEGQIHKFWDNITADLPTLMSPPLHPVTHKPIGPEALQAIFPDAFIEQEVSSQQNISIPEEVLWNGTNCQ